ncbi:hypothetical protein SERLADRAFT_440216 [Serpula lacrymans var. lacrymans S7.9]|nr:uncharacterized protein SERLADRAFT_440216 [Serpula lacrymans var. lacrymans S7.9]EGO22199.1 hypothetical protein SERLADRAFT_440216 [Serpula lacrymans var. lacrymans S7.9]
MESNVGVLGDSSSVPVASAATNEPRARGKAAHRRRRATDKERVDQARRMRGRRLLIKDEKDKIRSLLASRQDHALPSGELQLWRAVAEYIERLQATNASLKRLAGVQ